MNSHRNMNDIRERCVSCDKQILCHQKVIICRGCNKLYHAQCSEKNFSYDHVKKIWVCNECHINANDRYNPFECGSDDKYDPTLSTDGNEDVRTISNILKSCDYYDRKQFDYLSRDLRSENGPLLSLVFNNIDGNASNFDHFVADLNQYKERFAVIAIAETNMEEQHKGLYKINGYNSEYNDKAMGKKKGSGLAIYLNNDYQFTKLDHFCRCSANLEALFVEVTNMEIPQTIGVIYRPPNGDKISALQELDALMKLLPDKNVAITGDFNIDLLSPSRESSEFEQILYCNNLIPLISLSTHEKPGCRATLIDNILVNSTERILRSGILKSSTSHHHPVFCFLTCVQNHNGNDDLKSPKYDYCETNVNSFLDDLRNEVQLKDFDYNEQSFENFIQKVNEKIDENFKIENGNGTLSKRNRLMNPWITSGIIASVCTKYYHYRAWKSSCNKSCPLGDSALYQKYKDHRQILCKVIKSAKKKYYGMKFDLAKGNIKKTWELINELRGKTKSDIKASFIIDGRVVTERREIANSFNSFFSSIARKLNCKVQSSVPAANSVSGSHPETFRKYFQSRNSIENSIFLWPCETNEIEKIIRELENGKASDISITILKKSSALLSSHLAGFFNWFLNNGIFPKILKMGTITPIFKKGDPRYLDNYRPVSTLPIFGNFRKNNSC